MNLVSSFKIMVFATVVALIYTHMQMQIVEYSYKAKEKQRRIHELQDNNGILTHQILVLKSAKHLGEQLLNKDDALQFIGRDRVMTINAPVPKIPARPSQKLKDATQAPMWNWLSFLSIPEARAFDR